MRPGLERMWLARICFLSGLILEFWLLPGLRGSTAYHNRTRAQSADHLDSTSPQGSVCISSTGVADTEVVHWL